ncbi:MAG: hypothetical protein ACRENG_38420 [bacterium]
METPKKFVAVPGDDGNVKLIPAEGLDVVRMIDAKSAPGKVESKSSMASIFWILILLALLWYLAGGWETLSR